MTSIIGYESNTAVTNLAGYGINFGKAEARQALATAAASAQNLVLQTNYAIPAVIATVASGATNSTAFIISGVDKVHILAPVVLAETATLQVSIDNEATWRNPLNSPLNLTASQALSAADLAPCSGLFRLDVRWRILLSTNAAANRVFNIFGVK